MHHFNPATDQVKEKEITTVMLVGNVVICHGYLHFLLKKIGLVMIEKIPQPLETVFHHSSKHLRLTLF